MNDSQFATWEMAVEWLIAQPDQQALVRACYFDRPLLAAAERFSQSDEWQAVRCLIANHPGCALDVGAGMGIASYALTKAGWRTTALEPDPSTQVGAGAIRKLAVETGLPIEVCETFGESLPFANGMFDLIHARQVLHHARDLKKFCVELFRVLKPGGRLLATREHVISNAKQLPAFLENHPLHKIYGGENAFLKTDYLTALRQAGFVVSQVMGPWDSVINIAPLSAEAMKAMFLARFGGIHGARALAGIAFSRVGFEALRVVLATLDRRPGRLYTFVADKPEAA